MFDLSRLQRGLEALYRIDPQVEVEDFLIGADALEAIGVRRRTREQLLLSDSGDVGLFVCDSVLRNLARSDPGAGLDDDNLADFLLALEGVSHFVYLAWRAGADQPVSALELELQAEVDKYVTCLLLGDAEPAASPRWRRRLYEQFAYEPDLDHEERDRYQVANQNAQRYATSLERRFVDSRRVPDMLAELRRFYRLSLGAKLAHIAQAA